MKLKTSYFFTLRENVKDEDSTSGNLLVRSGMIKKNSSGIYMYLPLGYRVLKKIEQVIREEMDMAGAQEVLMPALIPEEVYEQSGRRALIGSSMFSLKDRFDKPFVLGPTHEELFLMAAQSKVKSYKDLPFNIYQFQTKFRDEPRPRFGLIRVREFIMKDAYSFDTDLDGLEISYRKMDKAYRNSFDRMGLNYKVVTADTGVMGGLLSEEFQAVTDIGEDTLVLCDNCDFSSNIEVAPCVSETVELEPLLEVSELYTPNVGKIKDLVDNYQISIDKMTKSMIYKIDNQFVLIMVRSDDEINEVKLQKLFNAQSVALAENDDVVRLTNAKVGFAGPVGSTLPVIADNRIKSMSNFLVGANKTDYHLTNVNVNRDFTVKQFADIRNIREGDVCPRCNKGHIHFSKGIEIGNIFKLGDKYAKALGLNFLDQNNQLNPVIMGSYGIGPGRCMAAIVEQNHDDYGIIWPKEIAPYSVAIVIINTKVEAQSTLAEELYQGLKQAKVDVILDDRDERPGVKFNDMDLIGVPVRITVGKTIEQGQVEVKFRNQKEVQLVDISNVFEFVKEYLSK
ncbi:MAG TPA: proline--tRNA ligase [Erysipelotrichaceae bacterium]|nr:proline--tRNA ligase [Erysipelotrichaceae bacterium]